MNWTVVGASGLIGRHLCRALADRGDSVAAVSRGGASLPGARVVRWDAASGPPPEGLVGDADVVVNLAGASIGEGRWSDARKATIVSSRVETTTALVEAIAACERPPVLVNASAVGYYGTGDATVTEQSPAGDDFLARTCAAWERAATAAASHGSRVVITRFGVVLAPDGGALPRQITPARLGLAGPMGGGRQWVSWVHIDDVVGLIVHAATSAMEGPVNVTAPEPVRQAAFAKALGRALGRPLQLRVPAIALRLALGEMSMLVLRGQRAVPDAALAGGYAFAHPDLDEALADVLGREG